MLYSYVYQKVKPAPIDDAGRSPRPTAPQKAQAKPQPPKKAQAKPQPRKKAQAKPQSHQERSVRQAKIAATETKRDSTPPVKTPKARESVKANSDQNQDRDRLIKDILPVVDALDRAVDYVKGETSDGSLQGVLNGLSLVQKMFIYQLEKNQIVSFDSQGHPFDPSQHEAIESKHSEAVEAGNVLGEVQRGFTFNGNLLRPSLVTVSLGTEPPVVDGFEENSL